MPIVLEVYNPEKFASPVHKLYPNLIWIIKEKDEAIGFYLSWTFCLIKYVRNIIVQKAINTYKTQN